MSFLSERFAEDLTTVRPSLTVYEMYSFAVVLGFYVPYGHTETGPRFKVSSKRLEKPKFTGCTAV